MTTKRPLFVNLLSAALGALLALFGIRWFAIRQFDRQLTEIVKLHTNQLLSIRSDIENDELKQRKVRLELVLAVTINELSDIVKSRQPSSAEASEALKQVITWRERNPSLGLNPTLNAAIENSKPLVR